MNVSLLAHYKQSASGESAAFDLDLRTINSERHFASNKGGVFPFNAEVTVLMTKKNVPKVPPRPLDLPSAISPYEKESSEAEAKLREFRVDAVTGNYC